MSNKRIFKENDDIYRDLPSNITSEPIDDDHFNH